ncbi:hypothetical protein HNR23_003049 [Nocardiopsis mwathae]|uniref:Helicase C-terminal domain-containing protein n=1 Tax=Nocardiopsis mwathae TaxID=1472723 RepID=A0A7W9YIV2_9ACTN|nr:DISARM system helicase DrmA [Nocardiopsis mwathae]MBB6172989.1 hypothetical protein [Nocardiopsis mwathae]
MGDQPVLKPPTPQEIRGEFEDLVVTDLYGPIGGDEEELGGDRPTDYYILGRLAPNGALFQPEEQDNLAENGLEDTSVPINEPDDPDPEPEAPSVPSMYCSAYGLTAAVDPDVGELRARASWGRYVQQQASGAGAASDPRSKERVYRREPGTGEVAIPLTDGAFGPLPLDPEQPRVCVRGRVRTHKKDKLVTVFLVNGETGEPREQHKWLFQAELELTAADGSAPVFRPRDDHVSGGDAMDRAEQRRLAMTHRYSAEFAIGHSTAVAVDTLPDDPRRATAVRTAAVPRHELAHTDVPSADADPDLPELADVELDMKRLAALGAADVRGRLEPLVTGYRAWIARQRGRLATPAAHHLNGFTKDAEANLADAEEAAGRIAAAIDLLATDAEALRCFRFANAVMSGQRVHTLLAEERRRAQSSGEDPDLAELKAELDRPKNHRWRPFQLAFILLNLPSLTDPGHPERTGDHGRMADLLWFPTGGGKTEAYLGLTAYTLAIRRRQGEVAGLSGHAGVAVLMRYTLRLLTIDQFQRAAALICACEVERREDESTWGREPFRIGLWVGNKSTPNRVDQAHDWLKAVRNPNRGSGNRAIGSPHQLVSCPWCGSAITAGQDIDVDMVERRAHMFCPDLECPFSRWASGGEGLPVLVVDEEIYRLVPSLVIATVDKFAQLAWKGETQALFGRVERVCTRHGYLSGELQRDACGGASAHQAEKGTGGAGHPAATVRRTGRLRPPDLIIQDELHLISGPLGSMVGLYETAVDRLAAWSYPPPGSKVERQVRPKVIASTATVRRAAKQIGSLFAGRTTRVFPPQSLDAADNFFSRQRPTDRTPGRRYVGICAHGVRIKSAQIRVYTAVLAAAQKLHDRYGANEVTDPYMTLVGYFNSLRDLGGMRRLVEDDVSTRLGRADGRGLARRRDPIVEELTSRMSSDDIPKIRERLGRPFTRVKSAPRPIDVLLATNMIAVGLDVPRLGVMVVNNQPKSTAEYIQATSRVGRRHPGVVFTVYNWSRPRDLSHYERFDHFHATMYRHVEALSVTPFAPRAVDRGLMGLLVALVRNLESTYNANATAQIFDRSGKDAAYVLSEVKNRARDVTGDQAAARSVEDQLNTRLDIWDKRRREQGADLVYKLSGTSDDVMGLLAEPRGGGWGRTTCPTSLREVEDGIRLVLDTADDLGDDDAPGFRPRGATTAKMETGQGA